MEKLLIDLLKIPSESQNLEELNNIVDYVENFFKGTNAIIERFIFNNKPSIIISNFGGKKADIILNGHLDVVPKLEEDQFKPYKKDGKLYARGAGDMKAGVAIMMTLMKKLLKENFKDKKINLILTTDEEVGGFDGVGKLVEKGYEAKVVLIPDSGSVNEIVYSEKGIIHLNLIFNGISCHASRPWLGENAIDNLFKFYNFLKNYIENPKKIYGLKDHWGSTVSLNVVNGGVATNTICDNVEAKIDIRLTEEFDIDNLLKQIKQILKITNGEIKELLTGDILYSDPSNPFVNKYFKIAKKYNSNVSLAKEHGASDGRFFAKNKNIVLLQRPGCGNIHGKKEFVNLSDLDIIYKIYEDFIYNF